MLLEVKTAIHSLNLNMCLEDERIQGQIILEQTFKFMLKTVV